MEYVASFCPVLDMNGISSERIARLECGPLTSAAISVSGALYFWGCNSAGQCGVNSLEDAVVPTRVHFEHSIEQVSCGRHHSLAIDREGGLFSWGLGSFGQLGTGACHSTLVPRTVEGFSGIRVRLAACGDFHSLAVVSSLRWKAADIPARNNGDSSCTDVPRVGHSAAMLDDQTMVVYGGFNGTKTMNGLALCHFEPNRYCWEFPVVHGDAPPHRTAHTAVVRAGELIVFGGATMSSAGSQGVMSDLWLWNRGEHTWRCPPRSAGAMGEALPCARYAHAAAQLNQVMVVFGGCTGQTYLNDLWLLHLDQMHWTQPPTQGKPPLGRARHSLTAVGNKLWVFGGWNGKQASEELHCLDMASMQWSEPCTTQSIASVGARCAHSCVAVDGSLWVVGGWDGERDLGAVRSLNLDTMTWEAEQTDQHSPVQGPCVLRQRHGHSTVAVGNRMHIFGGSSAGCVNGDVESLDVCSTEAASKGAGQGAGGKAGQGGRAGARAFS